MEDTVNPMNSLESSPQELSGLSYLTLRNQRHKFYAVSTHNEVAKYYVISTIEFARRILRAARILYKTCTQYDDCGLV